MSTLAPHPQAVTDVLREGPDLTVTLADGSEILLEDAHWQMPLSGDELVTEEDLVGCSVVLGVFDEGRSHSGALFCQRERPDGQRLYVCRRIRLRKPEPDDS